MHTRGSADVQVRELNETVKDMGLSILKYKRKFEESDSKLKDLKQLFEFVRNERNICNKNLVEANVSEAVLLLK